MPTRRGGWREEARGKAGRKPGPTPPKQRIGTVLLSPAAAAWLAERAAPGESLSQAAARIIETLAASPER